MRLLALVAANLFCLGGYVMAEREVSEERGGYREIDIEAVEAKIREGDLVRHEARWYHVDPDAP
jgi:hypothetical protein